MEKEQTTSIKIGLFVFLVVAVVVAVVFMILFFMKPSMEKNKATKDLQQIIKQLDPNLTDDQAKCLANKSADGNNAQQIIGEIGSLCVAAEIASLVKVPVIPVIPPVTPPGSTPITPITPPGPTPITPITPPGPTPVTPIPTPVTPIPTPVTPIPIKVPDMCKNYLPKFQNANSWAKDCNVGGTSNMLLSRLGRK